MPGIDPSAACHSPASGSRHLLRVTLIHQHEAKSILTINPEAALLLLLLLLLLLEEAVLPRPRAFL